MPSASSRRKNGPARKSNGKSPKAPIPRKDWFSAFAQTISNVSGRPVTFFAAVALVLVWALSGPLFGFGETWQLVINTATTIVTFLMVFLIQSTQNRDTAAVQVKLAEILMHMPGAPKQLADAEDMSEKQLDRLHEHYKARAKEKAGSARRRARA